MIKYYLTPKAIKAGCRFDKPRDGDAGYDIYAAKKTFLEIGVATWVSTGLHVQIPSTGLYSRVGLIRDRSSMAGENVFTFAGVIDSSYRGEIKIRMMYLPPPEWLELDEINRPEYLVKPGQKIAQMIIVQHLSWSTTPVDLHSLQPSERGEDGFGSTGK